MSYLPVKDYEGLYEVSNIGQIKSLARTVTGKDGSCYPFPERTLKPSANKNNGYLQVSLWKNNRGSTLYVHRLVAEAFIPNPQGLQEVNHINGVRQYNCLDNLEWVSRTGNAQHAVLTGLRTYTNRLSYDEFYDCLLSVIAGESYASLAMRVPYQVPYLSTKLRQIAKELGLTNELNESLHTQAINRARINGAKHH